MDREQHITQDAAEIYAVYLMAKHAEDTQIATSDHSTELYRAFESYLWARRWTVSDFGRHYPRYKQNADTQIPAFIYRLKATFPLSTFLFAIDEAAYRNRGLKADFTIKPHDSEVLYVSLKNYVGSSGIHRPQVSSGTFLSFAMGFLFERAGVGTFVNPNNPQETFQGSNTVRRNEIMQEAGMAHFIEPLAELEKVNSEMREELLQVQFYNPGLVKSVVARIVPRAREALLDIFEELGESVVRHKLLERAGLDGSEEALYFDHIRILDTITNTRFATLRKDINDPSTTFRVEPAGQSLRFLFEKQDRSILSVDVPLTVNTNGAWYRPKTRYTGARRIKDKNAMVDLQWGELRPYKSKEIATSTNTYIDLSKAGMFE